MNRAIALRLLWKEYRVQRGLWLSMALAAFLLQWLVWLLVDRTEDTDGALLAIGFLMTSFYAVGSGAVTFAVEREEGTHLRLVSMSAPPGLTLFVKLVFGVLLTVVLLAVTFASGVAFGSADLGDRRWTELPAVVVWMLPAILLASTLGGLLWGMFYSLLCGRVLVALAAAAGTMIASYSLVQGILTAEFFLRLQVRGGSNSVERMIVELLGLLAVLGLFALALVLANWMLTSWWLSRGFAEVGPVRRWIRFSPVRFQWARFDGGMRIEVRGGSGASDEVLTAERALGLPAPRYGLAWIYSHRTWAPLRSIRFLCWKEALESRRLFLGMLAFGGLVGAILAESSRHQWGDHLRLGLLYGGAALICGLMTFRTEQSGCRFRWYAVRGIRPASIWWSKHIVWLSRLAGSVVLLVTVSTLIDRDWFGPTAELFLLSELDDLGLMTSSTSLGQTAPGQSAGLWWVAIGRAAIVMLVFYAIGQAASLLFRRTVLAAFLGFVGCLVAFLWMDFQRRFDVAFSCAVLPIVPTLFLCTWLRSRRWLLEDNRLKGWLAPAASLCAGAAVCLLMIGLFRVYQIPAVPPVRGSYRLADGTVGIAPLGVPDHRQRRALAPVSSAEAVTADLYRKAKARLTADTREVDTSPLARPVAWADLDEDLRQWTVANRESLLLARQASSHADCAFVSPAETTVETLLPTTESLRTFVALAVAEAHRLEANGDLDAALELYRDALVICRHVQGRGCDVEYRVGCHALRMVLAGLVQWSAHEDIDGARRAKADALVRDHRRKMVSPGVVNLVEFQMLRNTVASFYDGALDDDRQWYVSWQWAPLPGSRARNLRLLDWLEAHSAAVISSYVDQTSDRSMPLLNWYRSQDLAETNVERSLHRRWLATTDLVGPYYKPAYELCLIDAGCEADVRATRLAMELMAQKRKTGQWPANLDGLTGAYLFDPWTGRHFAWYPQGIPNQIETYGLFIPKDVPFLFSGGSMGFNLQSRRADHTSAYEHAESNELPSKKVHYSLEPGRSTDSFHGSLTRVWLLP